MSAEDERVAAKVAWSEVCPACKGAPGQGHRYDETCREEPPAASIYVCAECLNVLDQDETACAMACPAHPGAMRLWIEVPVSREVIREVVEREYGVTT